MRRTFKFFDLHGDYVTKGGEHYLCGASIRQTWNVPRRQSPIWITVTDIPKPHGDPHWVRVDVTDNGYDDMFLYPDTRDRGYYATISVRGTLLALGLDKTFWASVEYEE